MFRKWEIPVKDLLRKGDNELKITFRSAVEEGKKRAKQVPFTMPESPRSFVRKAQYQFGWDWGPRLVTAGIWKDVKIEFWNTARIETIKVEQKNYPVKVPIYIFTLQFWLKKKESILLELMIKRIRFS